VGFEGPEHLHSEGGQRGGHRPYACRQSALTRKFVASTPTSRTRAEDVHCTAGCGIHEPAERAPFAAPFRLSQRQSIRARSIQSSCAGTRPEPEAGGPSFSPASESPRAE
jgi:hypothetical protein